MKEKLLFAAALATLIFFSACDKEEPEIPNEEELITTLIYTLTPLSGGAAKTLTFKDLDGDGGEAPTITVDTLEANTSYLGALELLDESVSPVENITIEIEEESAEHQFFFETTVSNLDISYSDQDAEGNAVGLSSTLVTEAASSGTLTIILRHEPNKMGAGVAGGDITNAGGETDIEVTFPIDVQ